MPPSFIPTCRINAQGLNNALNVARQFSSRAPEKIVVSAAFFVAVKTQEYTPSVSAQQIDSGVGTIITARIGKTGKPLSLKQSRNRILSSGKIIKTKTGGTLPLAVAIIQSQVNPNSKYNRMTNHRFQRPFSPFRGVTREQGRAAMRLAEHAFIAARRMSNSFLRGGWSAVAKMLRGRVYGATPALSFSGSGFGDAAIESSGTFAMVTIENMVGTQAGKSGDNSQNYNQALHKYSGPALQRAMDEQAISMMRHYHQKMFRKQLLIEWNKTP